MNTAYFVKRPRRIDELKQPHLLKHERPYEILSRAELSTIEYGNFTTDMLADRRFIEQADAAFEEGEVMKCLLVSRRGRRDGVLVVPENGEFVKWAAYVPDVSSLTFRE